MRRPKIDIATWQAAAAQAAAPHSKISQLFDDYWMARGGPPTPSTHLLLSLQHPLSPSLAPSIIPFNSRCPDSCFKCFVSGSLVFLAYEKEKCRLGDVFMVNDLCLAARSVKVIEWEMLSAAGAGKGQRSALDSVQQQPGDMSRRSSHVVSCFKDNNVRQV